MMTNRPTPDEFDTMVRHALDDVAGAVQTPAGLADRLLGDVRRPVVRPGTPKAAKRWVLPLLAAACIVALAVAAVVVANVRSHHGPNPPANSTTVPTPHPKPKQPALPHFRATDISFSDAQHGWALGDARCESSGNTDCPALLATTDGGASWHPLAVPAGLVSAFDSASCGTNGTLAGPCVDSVLFANASDGYLWSLHEIYSTTDGGQHWRRYVDPAHDWDGAAQMVVAGDTVVRLAPIHQCSSGCAGSVQVAPGGTTDWQVVTPAGAEVGLYSSALATVGKDVYLFAGETASNTSRGILRSSDGGQHWQPVAKNVCGAASSPDQDPFWGAGGVVADNGGLVAMCLNAGPAGSIRVAAPGAGNFSDARPLPGNDSQVVEAAHTGQRILVAQTNTDSHNRPTTKFYVTTNGGLSWRQTIVLPVGIVRFSSGTDGYAVTPGGAYYATSNGGISWQEKAFSV